MSTRLLNGRILLVSDDPEANNIWVYLLAQKGMEVLTADSASKVLTQFTQDPFDLLVVNYYFDFNEALTLSRQLRPEIANPILLFIGTQDESVLLDAYEAGIDECIVKPISHRLFTAKITAWLRRSWTVPTEALDHLQFDALRLDSAQRQIVIGQDAAIKLTNLEFRVLHLLMSHRGQVLDTNVIVDRVWGHTGNGDSILLKNVIYRLRRKIEANPSHPRLLQTVPGEGYTFRPLEPH
ncbi:MAG: response regulator transcription factor [Ardenticatenaceae bacterium]|nr:response regulator transcription factor [Anaerolineales bacterium]MCB8939478.1 response regulator transcription factor [Ardenticatenaceae bacterium]MCB8975694.1 response regulator transcription factor [Ardenticatenaceae bacterium]